MEGYVCVTLDGIPQAITLPATLLALLVSIVREEGGYCIIPMYLYNDEDGYEKKSRY